jgi:hypothetical protein
MVVLLAGLAAAAPEVAMGSTTGGTRAPGPDLASGGVVAPDPAPVKPAPRHTTTKRAPPAATTPAPSVPAASHTRVAVATAAVAKHPAAVKRSRRHQHGHRHRNRAAARVARAPTPIARIVSLPAGRLVAQATEAQGPDGRLVRAAIALFLVALVEASLLLRVATQLPRAARWR